MKDRIIFHCDCDSAFLSWSAVDMISYGSKVDLRQIPSIVGGSQASRHGIVLAKSKPAKKFGIQTGEPVIKARQKCPDLVVVPPNYRLYTKCSNNMVNILREYACNIQRYSIDECFLDVTDMKNLYPDYIKLAYTIKDRIKNDLGFTVSIGVSSNKLLAKMGSELKKPDGIDTLFPDEIKNKMWPLPVEDLFGVGRATAPKLHDLGIVTIGQLANFDIDILNHKFKSYGSVLWQFANGIEDSTVRKSNYTEIKGIGNSTTLPCDVVDKETAHIVILSLCESVGMRLRDTGNVCNLVSVSIKTNEFFGYSRQRKFISPTDCTIKIAEYANTLFDEVWKGEPIRHLGVRISNLSTNELYQTTLFDDKNIEQRKAVDAAMDKIRSKYGDTAVMRSVFLHSGIYPVCGGLGEDDYPLMSSIL